MTDHLSEAKKKENTENEGHLGSIALCPGAKSLVNRNLQSWASILFARR